MGIREIREKETLARDVGPPDSPKVQEFLQGFAEDVPGASFEGIPDIDDRIREVLGNFIIPKRQLQTSSEDQDTHQEILIRISGGLEEGGGVRRGSHRMVRF